MHTESCRCCRANRFVEILNLGLMPVADRLVSMQAAEGPEPKYPLAVLLCEECGLVQLNHTVPRDELFCNDYPYYSSFSPELLEHARGHAQSLISRAGLGRSSFVVEAASNDGYLLRNFVEAGIRVLGIDPADGPARAADRIGVPTVCEFLDLSSAERIVAEHGKADVVIGNNVLAHVADQREFLLAIALLLKPSGIASMEVPYLRSLIEKCEFDTIYHQHFCYFSVTSVDKLLRTAGMYLQDVQPLTIHGGSLRLTAGFEDVRSAEVERLLREEEEIGICRREYFSRFAERVQSLREDLLSTLRRLRGEGRRIAAYGAAAKGATMLNYIGIGPDTIEYVVDRNTHKHGKFMPGQRIPILPAEHLAQDQPDHVLLLAWNFADEIMTQQQQYRASGGHFIIPVPAVRIV